MTNEQASKIIDKLEALDRRLSSLETATVTQLQKLQNNIEFITNLQQEDSEDQADMLLTLQRIDAKMSAVMETQKLNFEILRVFSADLIQH